MTNEQEKEKEIVLNIRSDESSSDDPTASVGSAASTESLVSSSNSSASSLPSFGEPYETIALIGEGGMGTVYKVKDKYRDQFFAIKLLKPELASDLASLKRFEKEAEAATKLTHENLVTVYQHGTTNDGTPFLVMEILGGENLGEFLKQRGPLPLDQALELVTQIAEALKHVHKAGIVHRDLKPSNIILQSSDPSNLKIKLADFGIASALKDSSEGAETLTKTGDIVGSPSYMSPEQCLGQSPDFSSDLYSLGCVIFAVLTTKPPFEGSNPVQIILQHINAEPPKLRRDLVQTDEKFRQLQAVLTKCLAKDKTDRYSSVSQFMEDLERVKTGEVVQPKLFTVRRKKALVKFTAIFIVLLIASTVSQSLVNKNNQPPPPVPPISALPTGLAGSLQQQAFQHFIEGDYERALPLLEYVSKTYEKEGKKSYEAFTYQCIGQCYLAKGEYATAEPYYQRSLYMMYRYADRNHLDALTTEPKCGYIYVLRGLGRNDEALAMLRTMKVDNMLRLEEFYLNNSDSDDEKRVRDLREELEKLNAR